MFGLVGYACIGGFLLSLAFSFPDQEFVAFIVRALGLLVFLYLYQQFGRLLATASVLAGAIGSGKAVWPGPRLPNGTVLLRRFLVLTGLMVVPLCATLTLIFPVLLMGALRPTTIMTWLTLVIGAAMGILTFSRAYDYAVLTMTWLEQSGVGGDNDYCGIWRVVAVNRFSRVPAETGSAEFQRTTQQWMEHSPLQLWLNPNHTAHVVGGGDDWTGHWHISEAGLVRIEDRYGRFLELAHEGRTLTTLPEKTFVFERER